MENKGRGWVVVTEKKGPSEHGYDVIEERTECMEVPGGRFYRSRLDDGNDRWIVAMAFVPEVRG